MKEAKSRTGYWCTEKGGNNRRSKGPVVYLPNRLEGGKGVVFAGNARECPGKSRKCTFSASMKRDPRSYENSERCVSTKRKLSR